MSGMIVLRALSQDRSVHKSTRARTYQGSTPEFLHVSATRKNAGESLQLLLCSMFPSWEL